MKPGVNQGYVELRSQTEGDSKYYVPIFAIMETHGAVPILRQTEFQLSKLKKGQNSTIPLNIEVYGVGELTVTLRPTRIVQASVVQFPNVHLYLENNDALGSSVFSPEVTFQTSNLKGVIPNQLNVFVTTNCYLANRRVHKLTYHFQLACLIASPHGLYFPRVFLFDQPQRRILTVHRTDDEPVKLSEEIPNLPQPKYSNADTLLTARLIADDKYEITLNPQALREPGEISKTIHIRDQKSGMTLSVPFVAHVIGSTADIRVETRQKIQDPASEEIATLSITNQGEHELKLLELGFEKNTKFICVPNFVAHTVLLPKETVNFTLKVCRDANLLLPHRIDDTLFLRLSDINYPPSALWTHPIKAVLLPRLFRFTHSLAQT